MTHQRTRFGRAVWMLAVALVATLGIGTTASAWHDDPHVTVTGTIAFKCVPDHAYGGWVAVRSTVTGEGGMATYTRVGTKVQWSIDLYTVPQSGTSLVVTWAQSTRTACRVSVYSSVPRPLTGTTFYVGILG